MKISNAKLANGNLVNVEISKGLITKVNNATAGNVTDGIDAKSKLLIPGLVDLHTHLREPGREDAETVLTGSRSAVAGGYTAISAMANTNPVADNAGVVEQIYRLGKSAGLVDVNPIGAVTRGLLGEQLS
jgi:dihydroorotase